MSLGLSNRQSLGLSLGPTLGPTLGQKQILRLEHLQCSTAELIQEIERELEENICLESTPPLMDRLDEVTHHGSHRPSGASPSRTATGSGAIPDSREASLPEHLLEQIAFLDLDEQLRAGAELLIHRLDHRGRLSESPETIAREGSVQLEHVIEALAVIRNLEPAGVGARDLVDSLVLQIDRCKVAPALARILVERHLEDLGRKSFHKISRNTGHPVQEIQRAFEFIQQNIVLDPCASLAEAVSTADPDLVVEEIDGGFCLRQCRGPAQNLRVSSFYQSLLNRDDLDEETRQFLGSKIDSARSFMASVQHRDSTILRVAREIVSRQAAFLRSGWRTLKPMKMEEVADAVGLHLSTVSRAVAGVFMQSPRGIIELRRLFSGLVGEPGVGTSQVAIKATIREIVESEDSSRPLSDEQISTTLHKRGVSVSRRTVTNYRKSLGIGSANQRRTF